MRLPFPTQSRLLLALLMLLMCAAMAPDDVAAGPIRKYGSTHKSNSMTREDDPPLPPAIPKRHAPLPVKHRHPKASKIAVYRSALPPTDAVVLQVPAFQERQLCCVDQAYGYLFFREITPPPPREC